MKIIWSAIVKIAMFVLFAYCGIRVIFDSGLWAIPIGLIMVISCPLSTVLHEAGHSLFGACVKVKAVPDSKNYWSFLKTTFLDWWGESSSIIKPKTDKNLRGKMIFTALGGLAVNLVFIILGIIALCVESVPTGLCALLPASFHLFALNAMPITFSSGKSDGLIVLQLAKNDDEAKVMLAVLTVQAKVLSGTPIAEVDQNLLFDLPQIREDDFSFISLTELRYEYFAAKGDDENAQKWQSRFEQLKQEYLK